MPTISGSLNLVTDRPVDSISEVWVRARETRGQGDGLVVGVNDRVPVTDGSVEFTALPGAAVLVLVQNGMPIETLPMLITDEAQQSLRAAVQTVQIASSAEQEVLEQLAAEVLANVVRAVAARDDAQAAATSASSAARTEVARVVDGAPEDLDTIREVAEYAQSNRDITDQLNQAIGNKANKGHTHATSEVAGLDSALAGKAQGPIHFISTTKTSAGAREYSNDITVSGGGIVNGTGMLVPVAGWYLVTATTDSSDTAYMRITQNGEARLIPYNGSMSVVLYLTTSDYVQTPLHSTAAGQLVHCVMQLLR